MKKLTITCLSIILSLSFVQCVFGAGIVAETREGKLLLFEWNTHGSETPPVFESASLKVVSKAGEVLYEERFMKEHLVEYDEKNHEGQEYEVRLLIRGAKASFDLRFKGSNRVIETIGDETEIDVLVRTLKMRGRVLEPGSSLAVDTSIGKFTFKDVICGIYGDM